MNKLDNLGSITKGRTHYSHAKADARQDRKRQAAEARQRAYDSLSVPKRIELAKSRRGESKREIARLEKLLVKVPAAPAPQAAPVTEKKSKRTKKVAA